MYPLLKRCLKLRICLKLMQTIYYPTREIFFNVVFGFRSDIFINELRFLSYLLFLKNPWNAVQRKKKCMGRLCAYPLHLHSSAQPCQIDLE